MAFGVDALWHVVVAALGGLAVGTERQWSGHASGVNARFGGLRTFTMLGLIAGLSGWWCTVGLGGPAIVVIAGTVAIIVVAYFAASRTDIDATTEVAAIVILTAGVMAGAGLTTVASGIIALTVLLLVEKSQLHDLVGRIGETELLAAARFAAMAAIVLPLLPSELGRHRGGDPEAQARPHRHPPHIVDAEEVEIEREERHHEREAHEADKGCRRYGKEITAVAHLRMAIADWRFTDWRLEIRD